MRFSPLAFGLCISVASLAFGHGVQVQITFNPGTGKIETREIVHTAVRPASISNLKRVYVMPMLASTGGAGDGWYTRPDDERNAFNVPLYPSGPGVNFQYDVSQVPGTGWAFSGSASLPNLQGSNFGYNVLDGLKVWNGSSFVDPGAEQMQIMRDDATTAPSASIITTDSGPFPTMALSAIASLSSNAHSSVSYRLLGDGVSGSVGGASDGDDGIYLLNLQFTSTAAGVGASDPFYYVMYKNQDPTTALAAANSLGFAPQLIQVVPEPGMLGFVAAAGLLALRRRHQV